uniref:Amino acid permease/ SLC12A domain-containing protein n=1 Tax=mine drainage metagenome TaxID=410659 RepID=E6QJZ8_9ZZZZ
MLGTAIDLGALVSMLACVIACATATSRVLLKMARGGLLPFALSRTHRRFGTPAIGIAISCGVMFAVSLGVSLSGGSGSDIYGWFGSISVFGFLTAYALVAVALPFAYRLAGKHSRTILIASALTVVMAIAALIGSIFPIPPAPAFWFPYMYLAYLATGMGWFLLRRQKNQKRASA